MGAEVAVSGEVGFGVGGLGGGGESVTAMHIGCCRDATYMRARVRAVWGMVAVACGIILK